MTFRRPISPAVIGLVQMGVLELHTWGAKREALDRPDRIIMDLDPDPTVPWKVVVEAAQLVQTLLNELELQCVVKTTGGKGLHVVLPLQPVHSWDERSPELPRLFISSVRSGSAKSDSSRHSSVMTSISARGSDVPNDSTPN